MDAAVILAAAEVRPSLLYSIGPFGLRVSFAAQQQRALNTVWALEQQNGLITPGTKVAIIGAGLTGLTAAAALNAKGCEVWLYEAMPQVFAKQSNANHRYIHPTVNYWPEREPSPTTEFPFFEWFAANAAVVVDTIREEWSNRVRPRLIGNVLTGTTVSKLEELQSGGIRVHSDHSKYPTNDFPLVILAIGFSEEAQVSGTDNLSYWTADNLETSNELTPPLVVSGVGDGGLIDALRAVHPRFHAGQLAMRLAELLWNPPAIAAKTQQLEESVVKKFSNSRSKAAQAYNAGYAEILTVLPETARSLLGDIRKDHPVTLVGRLPYPYQISAAPIHKIMIAHAVEAGAIRYVQGQLLGGPEIKTSKSTEQITSRCIARHGPAYGLSALLTKSQIKGLKSRQKVLADLLISTPANDDIILPDYAAKADAAAYAKDRLRLAREYSVQHLGTTVGLAIDATKTTHFVLNQDEVASGPAAPFIPKKVFGIPLVTRPIETVHAYVG